MATKINYNNKAPFQTREDIPNENKANAEDMNEIKEVVNNNADELDAAKENIESLQNGQGTSNADITSLKNRVTTLEGDNTTNKADISSLKTDNETNKSNIEELQQDNETNKTNITNLQNNKVDKVEGKGLSTEDFTTELKTKLEGLENYNDAEIKQDIAELEEKVSTLEEDNTTNKTNIEALQEDNTQNKANIEDLQESQISQDSDIKALTNALPSESKEDENINIKGTIPVKFKEFVVGGNSKQETRSGKNRLPYPYDSIANTIIQDLGDGRLILNGSIDTNTSRTIKAFELKAGNYKFLFNTSNLPNNSYFNIRKQTTLEVIDSSIKSNKNFVLEEDTQIRIDLVLVTGEYSNFELDLMILNATEEDETWEQYGAMPSPEYPSEIQNVEGDVNVTVANKEKTEQQTVTFPLSEGQKLMLGDYLASDGIHHVRKQMELDGTEDWALALTNTDTLTFQIVNNNLPVKIPNDNDEIVMISNYFKGFSRNQFNNDKEAQSISPNSFLGIKAIIITINKKIAESLSQFKSWLATKKQEGKPVIIEYKLAEEEIEPYTEEQQEAYNELINMRAYEEETNVFSTNEISPIFYVTAIKDINSVIEDTNAKIEAINELLSTTATSAMLLDNMQSDLESEVM